MYTQYSLPVVHPSFELLKRSARILHFIAASVILVTALHQWRVHHASLLICITQLVIALDIFLLVFFTGQVLTEAPKLNLIFRFIESLTLLGITIMLLSDHHTGLGLLTMLAATGYFFLLHREARVIRSETVNIKPTGITMPDLLKDVELGWNEIKMIVPRYHSIIIETFRNKKIELNFRKNLKIDELERLDDFCKLHMAQGY